MAGYSPLKITGMSTGLVQERENFLLPDDAYPVLQNAYVWRERIKRKAGYQLLGRLQRQMAAAPFGNSGASPWTFNAFLTVSPPINLATEPNAQVALLSLLFGGILFTDNGDGTLSSTTPGNSGVINYSTGMVTLIHTAGAGMPVFTQFNYYPNLPVMGIRTQELQNSENDQTIVFDQKYAYIFNSTTNSFVEYLFATGQAKTWNAANQDFTNTNFFWSTNYWISDLTNFPVPPSAVGLPQKLFWVTNNTGFNGANSDPVRVTDGSVWIDFKPPTYGQIDATNFVVNWLSMLPYRGRLVVFNTWEGTSAASAHNFSNRIRWSTIGNPFIPFSAGPPVTGSWRDDIRGQGGFLDIPTSEDIIAVGFVRDNLVIYCERSTWQLRYTGRAIAPFQIERVNSELGAEGPFSSIQFDTSLVGIGDKGIVECDSYKSERIDIKIPDFVFQFQDTAKAAIKNAFRVHGIRDFQNRLAYWTVSIAALYDVRIAIAAQVFPNQRLVYNYENDSWALFDDSLTTFGTFQPTEGRTWLTTDIPWTLCDFAWINQPAEDPVIVGGNQQGFVEYLDEATTNDISLYIENIIANTVNPTVIVSPNHNMKKGFVIQISGIPTGTPFSNLNNGVFGIQVMDANQFALYTYDNASMDFTTFQPDPFIVTITGITNANPAVVTTSAPTTLVTGQMVSIFNVQGMIQINGVSTTITVINSTHFQLNGIDSTLFGVYTPGTGTVQFAFVGMGNIAIRDNFTVTSKKFNFLDEGQNIQLGYIDILMEASEPSNPGAITLNVYLDYDDQNASNTLPKNVINNDLTTFVPDTFFNSVIPTTGPSLNTISGTKFWQRVYCATRASFITLQYTFSNAQMAGIEQQQDVQIDAQILWIRKAGRMTQG